MDLPLNQAMWPGTHNSYNARSGGGTYGLEDNLLRKLLLDIGVQEDDIVIAQQEYAMTDQLRMGVRHIMLDAQWFAGKVTRFSRPLTLPPHSRFDLPLTVVRPPSWFVMVGVG